MKKMKNYRPLTMLDILKFESSTKEKDKEVQKRWNKTMKEFCDLENELKNRKPEKISNSKNTCIEILEKEILEYLQGKIYWLEAEIKQKKEIIEVCSLEEDKQMWLGYVKDYEKEMNLLMNIHRIVTRYYLSYRDDWGK